MNTAEKQQREKDLNLKSLEKKKVLKQFVNIPMNKFKNIEKNIIQLLIKKKKQNT